MMEQPRSQGAALRLVRVARSRVERIVARYEGKEAALWAGWALADLDAAIAAMTEQPTSQEAALRDIVTRALRAAFSFTNPAAVDGLVEATLAELRAALATTPPEPHMALSNGLADTETVPNG